MLNALSVLRSGVRVRVYVSSMGKVLPLGRPNGGVLGLDLSLSRTWKRSFGVRLMGVLPIEVVLISGGVVVGSPLDETTEEVSSSSFGDSGAGVHCTSLIVDADGSFGGRKSEFEVARLEDGEIGIGVSPTLTQGRTV